MRQGQPIIKIFVGGLPRSVAEKELDELFSQYGDVHRTKLVRNPESGRSRCFGFVEMLNGQGAKRAIDALHGCEIDGSTLTVSQARDSRPLPASGPEVGYRDVCLKNLAHETSEADLRELFGAIAPVQEIRLLLNPQTGVRTGIAFVTFGSAADADRALQLDGTLLDDRRIRVGL
jgi:RNA recognition motif-containing protein